MVEGPIRKLINNNNEEKYTRSDIREIQKRSHLFGKYIGKLEEGFSLGGTEKKQVRSALIDLSDYMDTSAFNRIRGKLDEILHLADQGADKKVRDKLEYLEQDLSATFGQRTDSKEDRWESVASDLKMVNSDAPQFTQDEINTYMMKAEEVLGDMVQTMEDRDYREAKIFDVKMARKKLRNYLDVGKTVRRGELDNVVRVMENTIRDLESGRGR